VDAELALADLEPFVLLRRRAQDVHFRLSSLHLNDEPASLDLKTDLAFPLVVFAFGPFVTVVCGALVSGGGGGWTG